MKKIYLLALIGACLTANAFFNTSGSENLNNLSSMSTGTQNMSGGGKTVKQGDNSNYLRLQSVPSGAIFMFRGNCPSGTRLLSDMAGRAPVGAGQLNDGTLNHNYTMNQTGGRQRHNLSLSEMPQHRHRYFMDDNTGSYAATIDNVRVRQLHGGLGADGGGSLWEYYTSREGGNGYHENRMPYRVMNFCQVI